MSSRVLSSSILYNIHNQRPCPIPIYDMHTQFDHDGEMTVALHAYLSLLQRPAIGHARITMTDRKAKQDLRAPGSNVVTLLLVLMVEHHINIPWYLGVYKILVVSWRRDPDPSIKLNRLYKTCANICMYTIFDILAFDAENPVSVQTSTSSATY